MKKFLLLLLAGGLSYIISLVALAPLSLVLKHLPMPQGLSFTAPDGFLWRGEVYALQWQNLPKINQLNWDWQPKALLKGEVALDWSAKLLGGTAKGNCSVTWRTHVHCATVDWDLPASALKQLPLDMVQLIPNLGGQVSGTLSDVQWKRQGLPTFIGQANWTEPNVTTTMPLNLGKRFGAAFNSDDTGIHGSLTSEQTQLDINGTQVELSPAGHYQAEVIVRPTPETNPDLRQGLGFIFGTPQSDGSYRSKFEGDVVLDVRLRPAS